MRENMEMILSLPFEDVEYQITATYYPKEKGEPDSFGPLDPHELWIHSISVVLEGYSVPVELEVRHIKPDHLDYLYDLALEQAGHSYA
jgi:hypothetical protein